MTISEIKEKIGKDYSDYTISEIRDYKGKIYVFLRSDDIEFDIPVLTFDKNNDEQGKTDMTSKEVNDVIKNGNVIYSNDEDEEENGDEDMDKNKIRKLLKQYGAVDEEIENFMNDLEELKDEIEDDADTQEETQENEQEEVKEDVKEETIESEEDDFNYLDAETIQKLKATEQGKDLIMNAPKMAKDELKRAIKEYLTNN